MKMYLTILSLLCFSCNLLAIEPMIVKAKPVVLGNYYSEPNSFFDVLLEVAGYPLSLDSAIEIKNAGVIWQTNNPYENVSNSQVDQLLNGGILDSLFDSLSETSIPVIFVDSIAGVYPTGTQIIAKGGNARVVVALGPTFSENWYEVIAREIGRSLGLQNSTVNSNFMNPDSYFPELYVSSQQTTVMRSELQKRDLALIPSVSVEFVYDQYGNRKPSFCPRNLLPAVFYRWQYSVDLVNWGTLDPSRWNPSDGQSLVANSNPKGFYRIKVIPIHERHF